MKAFVFPGQGAQFSGMGKTLYETHEAARVLFDQADTLLGFKITKLMFEGSVEDLKQTKVTQPAVFLHSVATVKKIADFQPDMVAGHSLGEFSALVAAGVLSFEDGLQLVSIRAQAMQKACEQRASTMAAVLGLPDEIVEDVCDKVEDVIVCANYNCPGQVVISGTIDGIEAACLKLLEIGAKRALKLVVGGAFHSPLMEPARAELEKAIGIIPFSRPICPVYQNVNAKPSVDPEEIKTNLITQLTSPVRWTQCVQNMIADGADFFIEAGPGTVLQGLIRKINKDVSVESIG
ncbi:MAG: ACP S-malonyltransferase [Tannerellaceae bacterium]|jgi:[acyl-carrier-protein] S-malonyltransferase|nr:ACP S-malonyltransferase [Tannerellaceae bacterium]